MGYHAHRKERVLEDTSGRLFKSESAVRPTASLPSPFASIQASTSLIEQRHGLLLQTRACPLVRTDITVDTARRAGRNRHRRIRSSSIRLRPSIQTRRRHRNQVTPALRPSPNIPQWWARRSP